MLLVYLSIVCFAVTVILFILAARQKRLARLPRGRVIYTDSSLWRKVQKPLFDPALRLAGRPDYLIRQGRQVIPIEIKSRQAPPVPYDSHIYQLAAYCLLVESVHGVRPKQGILHYADRSYAIDFTPGLEAEVRETIGEMQTAANQPAPDRAHQDQKRCVHCGYRLICDQALRI